MEYETKYLDETRWRRELEALTEEYERMLAFVDRELATAPEGRLVIQNSKRGVEYYAVESEGKRYLSKTDMEYVRKLAEKAYYVKVRRALMELIKRNHMILKMKKLYTPKELYQKMRAESRELVKPLDSALKDHIERWEHAPYETKGFSESEPEYYAKNGLRVRSKSEATIVDLLLEYGIPFRYESKLFLKGMGDVHPDFIVINKRTGEEFVWEHFGKMDDWRYANDMVKRVETYHFNGYYEGKNLIYTLESSRMPFGAKDARRIIEQYLL